MPGGPPPALTASYSGFVNGDTSSSLATAPTLGTAATATSPPGSYPITVGAAVDANYSITYVDGTLTIQAQAQQVQPGIYVLNTKASGALSLSGNAQIDTAGTVHVDSNSATALPASGNARVDASATDLVGGDQSSGNASFNHAPVTHAAAAANPLVPLAAPSTTGMASYGAVDLGGNSSESIGPGVYSQITVSGNARLTLKPGIYIITSGSITVSGNGIVSGSGVLICNSSGGLQISGNASVNLSTRPAAATMPVLPTSSLPATARPTCCRAMPC